MPCSSNGARYGFDVDTLTSRQVCATAGVTYRQLDYWTRHGYARPLIDARGCGSQRVWARTEADIIAVMAAWRRAGVELRLARQLAEDGAQLVYDTTSVLAPVA